MSVAEYKGKKYFDLPEETQKALHSVNIHTFRYYTKDRVWMASDITARHFGIDKFYSIEKDDDGPQFIYPSDKKRDLALYRAIINGDEFVSDSLRSYDGKNYYKVSLSVLEKDSNGEVTIIGGIIEAYDEKMEETRIFRSLSENYYSVFMVDFEKDEVRIYRLLNVINEKLGSSFAKAPNYASMISNYINNDVVEDERAMVAELTSYENLDKELSDKKVFIFDFRVLREGVTIDIRMKVVRLDEEEHLTRMAVGYTDVSDEKRDMVRRLAFHDSITGGYNFNYFNIKLKEENRSGYVVSLDIKAFRIVNSVCGITKGDILLKEINTIIVKHLGNDGYYGHVNADHFIFFVAFKEEEKIINLLNMISADIEKLKDILDIPKISPYYGVTYWNPGNRVQISFGEANLAKHRIKKSKEINYGFYRDEDNALAIEEKEIEDGFEKAIAEKQFEIWYQPKYNPEDKKLTGAEALVRWKKSDGTMVSPGKFIPVYEKNGMIRQLDEYVFTEVCKQQKDWVERIGKIVPVSVNLSRTSLYYDGIVEDYKKIVNEIGILPELVPIEITETATIDNIDIKILADKFFNAGFPLHIDDFGTGYSSLSTLNMMRFDTLKLDKTLVDYIGEFGGNKLIKHTVELAKDLGLHVTAEGVEKEEQVEFLKKLNCDNIQGFFFSRPMPLAFFEEKLKTDSISERYLYNKGQKYTYSGIVETYKRACNSGELRNIEGHAAIQINIKGEGEGAFYIEIEKGNADVQPYEYFNRDVLIVASAQTMIEIIRGELGIEEAFRDGLLTLEGDPGAALLLKQLVVKE